MDNKSCLKKEFNIKNEHSSEEENLSEEEHDDLVGIMKDFDSDEDLEQIRKKIQMSSGSASVTEPPTVTNQPTLSKECATLQKMSSNDSVEDVPIANGSSTLYSNLEIKLKILCGELKISNKRGKSMVWTVFGKVDNASGEEIPNIVACRICNSVYKFNGSATSNLVRHKCYLAKGNEKKEISNKEVDIPTKKKTIQVLTEWSIENFRPFKIVEDSGFEKVAHHLVSVGVKYGNNVDLKSLLPHPTTISQNINKLFKTYFEKIQIEITPIKSVGFGLTSDLWTDNYLKKTYISLTIHYIKNGNLVSRFLGMMSIEGEKCTNEDVRLKVTKLLNEFGLDLDDSAIIVTDRRSSMVAAFRNYNHIYCVDHLLNNTVQKSIEEVSEVSELSRLCSKLVKYFKSSGLNSKLSTTLKSFAPFRWNSIYNLLISIEENWPQVVQILQQENELNRINNISLSNITAIIKVLKPFEETLTKLDGENYPTIHLVYVYIHRLTKKCSVDNSDTELIKLFKQSLSCNLENIVLKNLTIYHKIGLFLFPPLNKLVQFSHDERTKIKDECKRMMKNVVLEDVEPQAQTGGTLGISPENIELISDFLPKAPQCTNSVDAMETEILKYEILNITFFDQFNILQWWEINKKQFPFLYKLSCKILATPANSAASKSVISAARNLITDKKRNIASNDDINEIMFLHYNISQDEFQTEINDLGDC